MPCSKFLSLLTYKALWLSKLNILQDSYEGMIPAKFKRQLLEDNQVFKAQFNSSEFHRQIDEWFESDTMSKRTNSSIEKSLSWRSGLNYEGKTTGDRRFAEFTPEKVP